MKRALLLALSMAVMMYTTFASAASIGLLGFYTLIIYRWRAMWRWWLPAVMAVVLFIPELWARMNLTVGWVSATHDEDLGSLPDRLLTFFQNYLGYHIYVWLALFLVATGLIVVFHQRHQRGQVAATAMWVVLFPVLMYYLNPLIGLFYFDRHGLWIVVGLGLWIGWGISYLPDLLLLPVVLLLVSFTFTRDHIDRYDNQRVTRPMKTNFIWLEDFIRPGDVFVIDPSLDVGLEEWDYYLRAYFPQGVRVVAEPDDARRVWYATVDWLRDADLDAAVTQGRQPGVWVGPPELLFRLYEAPPDPAGVLFENGLRFLGADVMNDTGPDFGPLVRREGQSVRLRLWWSVDTLMEFDYSIGVYLLDLQQNLLLASHDGPPNAADAPQETSRWGVDRFYLEDREIVLPNPTQTGEYHLCLAVYQWWDNARIPARGATDDNDLLCFKELYVKSW